MDYRQPKYYGEFKCSGSECTVNCCFGWNIQWSKDEIDKVKNAPNCSESLKELIENSFIKSEEKNENNFLVKLSESQRCPCQTEDGLCMIQKELGAEYLSDTCTVYPRFNAFNIPGSSIVFRGCYLSCQEVVRKLLNDEKATDLINVSTKDTPAAVTVKSSNSEEDIFMYPELKYRNDLFEFFYELIGDKKRSVETSIVLGALAAQKLTQLIEDEQQDRIPEALEAFKKQVHNAAALRSIDDIKPNYNVKFGIADKITENALDFKMTDVLKDRSGELDVDRYLFGEAKLNDMMKDRPFWLRNIALNLLIELCMPFKSKTHSIYENYSFFVAAVSCLKLNAVASAFAPEKVNIQTKGQTLPFEGIEKIYGLTGIISRRIFQDNAAFDRVLNVLSEYDMDSPAYLALLIK